MTTITVRAGKVKRFFAPRNDLAICPKRPKSMLTLAGARAIMGIKSGRQTSGKVRGEGSEDMDLKYGGLCEAGSEDILGGYKA